MWAFFFCNMNIQDWFEQDSEETYQEYRGRLTSLYTKYRTIWKAVRRPMDRRCYGYFGKDAEGNSIPKHANSKFRPRPIFNRFTGQYDPATFRMRDLIRCLFAEKQDESPAFFFYVNRQDEIYPEMLIDIDAAHHATNDSAACQVADDILQRVFADLPTFSEPSRNRKGRYIRFIVQREYEPLACTFQQRAEAAKAFNTLMLQFGLVLRKMHPKGQADAHVDNIKALLFHREKRIDDFTFYGSTELSFYEHSKTTSRFVYDERKERFRFKRGVLGTIALSGALAHKEQDRIDGYLNFTKVERQKSGSGRLRCDEQRASRLVSLDLHAFQQRAFSHNGGSFGLYFVVHIP